MTAIPLPSLSEVKDVLEEHGRSAWGRLLEAEKTALAASTKGPVAKYNDLLVGARVIGFFILDFRKHNRTISFAERAYRNLVQQVHSCYGSSSATEEECLKKVIDLGSYLQNHLIRAFRSKKGPVPTPSAHPSRPSFDTHKAKVLESLEKAPQNHSTAKKQALVRDGYRCCLSGLYDYESVLAWEDVAAMAEQAQVGYARTQCCHIFSEGTLQSVDNGENQKDHAASALTVLKMFGLERLVESLNGAGVHSLGNIITMDMELHASFDHLELWLEPTTTVNTYNVCTRPRSRIFGLAAKPQKQVTFSVPDYVIRECEAKENQVPALPDPDLIALHATCARVAWMSGAAELFDMLERDAEDMTVLASDGSSAYVLRGLLNLVPACVASVA